MILFSCTDSRRRSLLRTLQARPPPCRGTQARHPHANRGPAHRQRGGQRRRQDSMGKVRGAKQVGQQRLGTGAREKRQEAGTLRL